MVSPGYVFNCAVQPTAALPSDSSHILSRLQLAWLSRRWFMQVMILLLVLFSRQSQQVKHQHLFGSCSIGGAQSHTQTDTVTQTYTVTQSHKATQRHTQSHTKTRTVTQRHTQSHRDTHTQPYTKTHTVTQRHTQSHSHTETHTHSHT